MAGKSWPLLITYGVLLDCQQMTGIDMLGGIKPVALSALLIRSLLYCCLSRVGSGMSPAEIGNCIKPGNIASLRRALGDAYAAAMPDRKPRSKKKTEAPEVKKQPETMGWFEVWAMARIQFRLSDAELREITPRQLEALREAEVKRQRPLELMFAVLTAHVVNFSARGPEKMVKPERFLLNPMESEAENEGDGRLFGEEIMKKMAIYRGRQ